MGNSEVGHLNIGSGRIIRMDVSRIDVMIEEGKFDQDPTLQASMNHGAAHRLHIMGLVSDGGVHSMNTHLYALIRMAKKMGVKDVFIHVFTDGREQKLLPNLLGTLALYRFTDGTNTSRQP